MTRERRKQEAQAASPMIPRTIPAGWTFIPFYAAEHKPCDCVTHQRAGVPCVGALVRGKLYDSGKQGSVYCGGCGRSWTHRAGRWSERRAA